MLFLSKTILWNYLLLLNCPIIVVSVKWEIYLDFLDFLQNSFITLTTAETFLHLIFAGFSLVILYSHLLKMVGFELKP